MTRRIGFWLIAGVMVAVFGFAGCTQKEGEQGSTETTQKSMGMEQKAVAELSPTEGNEAHGTVTFTKVEDGIQVVADLEGVPEGEHGFHIHENGDCSAPDATSAGGHFNPQGMPHGGPNDQQRHVGDMGNVTADSSGHAHKEYVDHLMAFEGENSIIGKAVILHAQADDLTSQPTGNAGARIACGVIKMQGQEQE